MGKGICTQFGSIEISNDVISNLAGIATMECFGIVGMVSSRIISDGINELLRREALSKGVDVIIKDELLHIKVNVVVGYGARVSVVADNVIEHVKYVVEKHTGLTVDKVEVYVQGVRIID